MFGAPALFAPAVIRKSVTLTGGLGFETDWNLIDDVFGGVPPTRKAIVTITVDSGFVVVSTATNTPAMDLTGLPANSEIILINNGYIIGSGGDGGDGQNVFEEDEGQCEVLVATGGSNGGAGGNAVKYDGTAVDLTIHNASGKIYGGGGGGAGGHAALVGFPTCTGNAGGGGGGGAGGYSGLAGKVGGIGSGGTYYIFGIPIAFRSGSDGNVGQAGPTGGSASGGAGGAGSGSGAGGTGGAGGDFGDPGGDGITFSGGAAGKAVENNGTGTTSFATGGVEDTDYKGVVE